MILSEGRQTYLVQLIVDRLWKEDIVDYTDDDQAVRMARKGMTQFVREVEEIHQFVEQKIQSLKRGVVQGSPEWEVLYNKYYEEEAQKRSF